MRRALKLSKLVGQGRYRRGLRTGVAAAIEHEALLKNLTVASLIDVGANIGQFTLVALTVRPQLVVHAFEPLANAAARFEALFNGESNVTLHRVAAGEAEAETIIHVSGRPDSSSLLPISARQNEIFPGTAERSTVNIRVARVDNVLANFDIPEPILVKLDVQGFELSALKGMPNILARAKHVYVEVSFVELYEGQPLASDVIAWLAEQGFDVAGAYNGSKAMDGTSVQIDLLFTRR